MFNTLDPPDVKLLFGKIYLMRNSFRWKLSRMTTMPGSVAYEGTLGPVHILIIKYKTDSYKVLKELFPEENKFDGIIHVGRNVIHMPPNMSEEFFRDIEKTLLKGEIV